MKFAFEVRRGRLNIADPMLIDERPACAAFDLAAHDGEWRVTVVRGTHGGWGQRIEQLICRHSSLSDDLPIDTIISNEIGVDSATLCVYETADGIDKAYMSDYDVVIGPHGACSSSGIGDGGYVAYGHFAEGRLAGIRVVFIPDALGRMPHDLG